MNGPRRGLVVSTGKNAAWICLDDETQPRLAQLRRQTGKRFMPVPGDVVYVRILEDEKTVVDRVEPRTFHLERRTIDGRAKTIAANVDTLATVTALADPAPRLVTLDQLLAFAELESIEMRRLGEVEVCAIRKVGKDQFVGQIKRRVGRGQIVGIRGNVVIEVVVVKREIIHSRGRQDRSEPGND